MFQTISSVKIIVREDIERNLNVAYVENFAAAFHIKYYRNRRK